MQLQAHRKLCELQNLIRVQGVVFRYFFTNFSFIITTHHCFHYHYYYQFHSLSSLCLGYQCSTHDVSHDLIGSLQDLMHSAVPQISLNLVVLQVTVAAVHLQRVVAHLEAQISHHLLGQSAVSSGSGVLLIQQRSSISK